MTIIVKLSIYLCVFTFLSLFSTLVPHVSRFTKVNTHSVLLYKWLPGASDAEDNSEDLEVHQKVYKLGSIGRRINGVREHMNYIIHGGTLGLCYQ